LPPSAKARQTYYYGWTNLAIAALAMAGALPGRTQGLGLITEPLLSDLHIDRVAYATINLWATLLGAAFCLPCGRLTDRYGSMFNSLAVVVVFLGVTSWYVPLPSREVAIRAMPFSKTIGEASP
jgi:hypothetical protein